MLDSIESLISAINSAKEKDTLFDTYVRTLAIPTSQLARDVQATPTLENTINWLTVYAKLAPLAIEQPGEVTLALFQRDKELFQLAVRALSPDDQKKIEEFIASLIEQEGPMDQMTIPPDFAQPDSAITSTPVSGRFLISGTFDGTRVQLYQGALTLMDRSGVSLGSFQARTGGFVASFKTGNGPTPPGFYKIASFIPHPGLPGMTLNGVAFCFVLSPLPSTNVFGRSGLCIHPDQVPPGTHGCIGINADADTLRKCSQALSGLMQAGQVNISVEYTSATPLS